MSNIPSNPQPPSLPLGPHYLTKVLPNTSQVEKVCRPPVLVGGCVSSVPTKTLRQRLVIAVPGRCYLMSLAALQATTQVLLRQRDQAYQQFNYHTGQVHFITHYPMLMAHFGPQGHFKSLPQQPGFTVFAGLDRLNLFSPDCLSVLQASFGQQLASLSTTVLQRALPTITLQQRLACMQLQDCTQKLQAISARLAALPAPIAIPVYTAVACSLVIPLAALLTDLNRLGQSEEPSKLPPAPIVAYPQEAPTWGKAPNNTDYFFGLPQANPDDFTQSEAEKPQVPTQPDNQPLAPAAPLILPESSLPQVPPISSSVKPSVLKQPVDQSSIHSRQHSLSGSMVQPSLSSPLVPSQNKLYELPVPEQPNDQPLVSEQQQENSPVNQTAVVAPPVELPPQLSSTPVSSPSPLTAVQPPPETVPSLVGTGLKNWCNTCCVNAVVKSLCLALSDEDMQWLGQPMQETNSASFSDEEKQYMAGFRQAFCQLAAAIRKGGGQTGVTQLVVLQETFMKAAFDLRTYAKSGTKSEAFSKQLGQIDELEDAFDQPKETASQADAAAIRAGILQVLGLSRQPAYCLKLRSQVTAQYGGQTLEKPTTTDPCPGGITCELPASDKPQSIQGCLQQFLAPEKLTDGNQAEWAANELQANGVSTTNGTKLDSEKQLSIVVPDVSQIKHIPIQVKSFSHKTVAGQFSPIKLVNESLKLLESGFDDVTLPVFDEQTQQHYDLTLQLDSIINHKGGQSVNSGHYITTRIDNGQVTEIHDDARALSFQDYKKALGRDPQQSYTDYARHEKLTPYLYSFRVTGYQPSAAATD